MKMNKAILALSLTIIGCDNTEFSVPNSSKVGHLDLVISNQNDFDKVGTTFTLSGCPTGVSYITTPQSASGIILPTPNASSITCNISLTQLSYIATGAQFLFAPSGAAGLTGTIQIFQSNGAVTVTVPSPVTQTFIGTNSYATGLTAGVTFGKVTTSVGSFTSDQIVVSWIVNVPTNIITSQVFSPTAGTGANAVPPEVTSGTLFDNMSSNTVSFLLNYIDDTGAFRSNATGQTSTSIFHAQTLENGTSGKQCYLFFDSSNTTKPSWLNFTGANIATLTNYSSSQFNGTGYLAPVDYVSADALFSAASATIIHSGVTEVSGPSATGYYISTGNQILGYFDCTALLNYSSTNWGGLSQGDVVTISSIAPDWAKYSWFAVLGNDLNMLGVPTLGNAYTVVKIPAVAGQ